MGSSEDFRKEMQEEFDRPVASVGDKAFRSYGEARNSLNRRRYEEKPRDTQRTVVDRRSQYEENKSRYLRLKKREERKLTAEKGSARRANNNEKKKKHSRAKLAAGMAAAIIGLGTIGIIVDNAITNANSYSGGITPLIEAGAIVDDFNISEQTANELLTYNNMFESEEDIVPSKQELIETSQRMNKLINQIVKEKIAASLECSTENINIYNEKDLRGSAGNYIRITAYKNAYDPSKTGQQKLAEYYYEDGALGMFQNNMPKEFYDLICSKQELENVVEQLENSQISELNATKDIKKYNKKLQEFATMQVIQGKNNKKITLAQFDKENIPHIRVGQNKEKASRPEYNQDSER